MTLLDVAGHAGARGALRRELGFAGNGEEEETGDHGERGNGKRTPEGISWREEGSRGGPGASRRRGGAAARCARSTQLSACSGKKTRRGKLGWAEAKWRWASPVREVSCCFIFLF